MSLLAHAYVPHKYWVEAFQITVFLINRMPTPILHNSSPFETLFNQKLDYKFQRIFGSACWPNLWPYNSHKTDFRSKQCVFMGYSPNYKGYLCLHLPTGRTFVSRDVQFIETDFPFVAQPTSSPLTITHSSSFSFPIPSAIPSPLIPLVRAHLLSPSQAHHLFHLISFLTLILLMGAASFLFFFQQ